MSGSTPKVSVLMPICKTDEQHLREAIESVLQQTFKDFEFLILDDCPDDTRENIVKSYHDDRIKYSKNDKNLGITPSRNKLISMSQGEYLAVMDHDDISLPERFAKQVAYLDENKDVGVVASWVDCFPENTKLHFPADDVEIKKLLMEVCSIVHPSSMIRKSVLLEHGLQYEEEFTPSEDYCLWLRMIEFTKFHNLQEVLFRYRLHSNNTSKSQHGKMVSATEKLYPWVRSKYPHLYQMYLNDRTKVYKIKLFKIPLLKIVAKQNRIKVYLFSLLPCLTINRKVLSWPK